MKEITLKLFSDQKTVDPGFIQNLETFVEQNGYHLSENGILDFDLIPRKRHLDHKEFVRLSEEISQRIGPVTSNSAEHIREMRERR